jgi:ABC-type Zn uptake system ZnuABC Zn-binding protein ZnuA
VLANEPIATELQEPNGCTSVDEVHWTIRAALVVAPTLLVASCGADAADPDAGQMRVVTTVAPLTSIAANIGGDQVAIEGIVPEGTNSHTFEPPPQVAAALSEADVVFVNGLQLEEPTKALAESNMKNDAILVEVGDEVLPREDWIFDFSFPESDGKPNPHLWTDPGYAIKYAEVIARTFSEQDPANAGYYEQNLAAFTKKANALSRALVADQKTVPAGNLKLLTYHDAYAYFAKTYGWDVIGAVQPKNFEDPTPQEVAAIIDQVESENVPTIFGSEVFPSPILEQIANETGAEYYDDLRDDDLPGAPGEAEHSWLGLMRFDYVTMVEALGGDASALIAFDVRDVVPDNATYPQ